MKKLTAISLTLAMLLAVVSTVLAAPMSGTVKGSGSDLDDELMTAYMFDKLSNPENGQGEPDGINTNDETGFEANRYNSYAWAMEELGGYLYVGTNRNLYGSAVASIAAALARSSGITYQEALDKVIPIVNIVSEGSIPDIREMEDNDWIPQIIRINPETGDTKVVFQPDMEGVNPATEIASFRSVVKYNNKLYFGSLGSTRLQIVSIDEDDNAKVVYEASAKGSSLRACALWDNTIVFGGLDSSLTPAEDSEYAGLQPMVIRQMNPEDESDWSTIIADYRDFAPYANEQVYRNAGGTVWDMVAYNGKLYLVLAADSGFVMYAGQKATAEQIEKGEANSYGYIWTPVIGEGGKYNPGMAETPEGLNHGENDTLTTKDSTATPYIYNGKLYLGTFDNSTSIILSTFSGLMARMNNAENAPSLSTIYRAMYNAVNNPQKVYCMDENENIVPVEDINNQLANSIDDYVWRMCECNGKLYLSTFDPSVVWSYFTSVGNTTIILPSLGEDIEQWVKESKSAQKSFTKGTEDFEQMMQLLDIACRYLDLVNSYLQEQCTLEELAQGIEQLQAELSALVETVENETILELAAKLEKLMNAADVEGIKMIIEINNRSTTAEQGFSLYVTEDGENFDEIVSDGMGDRFNYGGRTLAVCNGTLYVGTANPFYGAQIWKVSEEAVEPSPSESVDPSPSESVDPSPSESVDPSPSESVDPSPSESVDPTITIGDVNGDGQVNTGDAVVILKYAAGMIQLDEQQLKAADANRNDVINTGDAVTILKFAAGIITEL